MLCLLLSVFLLGDPPLDRVILKSGKVMSGVVLLVNDEEVILAQGSRKREIPRDKVDSIEGPRLDYPDYVRRLHNLFAAGCLAKEAIQMADWCNNHGFLRDADFFLWAALATDPDNEEAHLRLGHKKKKNQWSVKVGNGGITNWDKLLQRRMEFKNAWLMKTAHFEIHVAGPLKLAVNSVAELEQTYAAFFDAFQQSASLLELQEPIVVHIYPDEDSFPSTSSLLDAFWDSKGYILKSYFRAGGASRMFRTVAHALTDSTAREISRSTPAFPGWLAEGMAHWLECALTGGNAKPGALDYDPSRLDKAAILAHQDLPKIDSLMRVLNYSLTDFGSSTGQKRAFAQSYTLFTYLYNNDDEAVRVRFSKYLMDAWRSKGSTSSFKKTVAQKKMDQLEKEWRAWVEKKSR